MTKSTTIIGFFLSFAAGMLLMWGIDSMAVAGHDASPDTAVAADGTRKINPGAVEAVLHVMSQCPYGVQAENGFKDAMEALGPDLDLKLEFIANKDQTGTWKSMHGDSEMKGNIAQACAMKYTAKWFDFVMCQNKDMKKVDTNWEGCAQQVGAPVDKLRACITGKEGMDLVSASYERSQAKGASGSPTIFIGGEKYQGGRKPKDFLKAVCKAYKGKKPTACANIPESPKVNLTMVGDKRCAECDTKRLEGQLRTRIDNPVVKTLDYTTPEGKAFYDKIKPVNLPVAVFDSTIDKDKDATAALGRFLKPKGDFKVISLGGNWNPVCADDGGCDLDECKQNLMCRKEEPNSLEVFVMSECPYGVRGLDAMKEVLENFKKAGSKINFKVNFIGDGDAAKLTSMHGQSEVDEDIREACAIKHYPTDFKYMDYIWCRNKNIKGDWKACTGEETGIDEKTIQTCFEGEGKQITADSFAYAKSLGFGASPTWLANGKHKFSGVDPETIKSNLCKHNEGLKGCENTLTGAPPRPAGAKQPGCE